MFYICGSNVILLGGLITVPVNKHVFNGDQGISSTANSLTPNSPYGTDQHVLQQCRLDAR